MSYFHLEVQEIKPFNPYPAIHHNPTFANSVDPDQMAFEEAIWSESTLFDIQFVNLNEHYMM